MKAQRLKVRLISLAQLHGGNILNMKRGPFVPGDPEGAAFPHLPGDSNLKKKKKIARTSFVFINIHSFILRPGS